MPNLWARTANYDNISVGDDLPIVVKFEFRPPVQSGETVNEDPVDTTKLSAYVNELLLKAFPPDNVADGNTTIETEILTDFLPGDTVSLSGQVVAKSDTDGKRTVECQVVVESEAGETVAKAKAVISF